MMLHPALKELRAFASDELSASARTRAVTHLTACQGCRDQVAWIESMQVSLRSAPRLAPRAEVWSAIEQRIARNDIVLLPLKGEEVVRSNPIRRAVIAAALVLLLVASAAAMVRRDSIRQWLNARATERSVNPGVVTPSAAVPSAAPVAVPTTQLAIAAVDGEVTVNIAGPDSALVLRVRMGNQEELELLASGAAGQGSFRSAPGRLTVQSPGAGELLLTLPRSARRVTLSIDSRIVLVKDRSELRVLVRADTAGPEFKLPVR